MTRTLILALFFTAARAGAQNFALGHLAVQWTDAGRANRAVPVEIYYPAETAGEGTPSAQGPFPVVCFGHGFVMTWDAYRYLWGFLAPQGFILAFPKTEGSLAPSHENLALDMVFVLNTLQAEHNNPGSLFYQHVAPQSVLMGHSMGGGAAFLAAAQRPSTGALVTFAAAETSPSAIAAAASLQMPVLLFSGGNDCVTPPPAHQIPMFDAVPGDCKSMIGIIGGSHCQMADANLLCQFGEATCSPAPAISREAQHAVIERYLLSWLRARLFSDAAAAASFESTGSADPEIQFQLHCTVASGVKDSGSPAFKVFPNPFSGKISIYPSAEWTGALQLRLSDGTGKLQLTREYGAQEWENGISLELPNSCPKGLYWLQLNTDSKSYTRKIWKN